MILQEKDLNNISDKVSKKQWDEAFTLFMRQVNGELWFSMRSKIRNRNIFQVKEKVYPRVCDQIFNINNKL